MKKFELGDIVKVGQSRTEEYFIVTDVADFTMDAEDSYPDIDYELYRIYPVSRGSVVQIESQDMLRIVAKNGVKEHKMMIDYIMKEREIKGIFGEPDFSRRIRLTDTPAYQEEVEKSLRKDEYKGELKEKLQAEIEINKVEEPQPAKFGEEDFDNLWNSDIGQKQVDDLLAKMDTHLDLLHKAKAKNNHKDVAFQKEQLEKVRQGLMELEYFQLEVANPRHRYM